MKMLMMLMVAAILFCSHQQGVVAREVAVTVDDDGNEVEIIPCWIFHWPWCPSPPPPPPPSPPPPPPKPSCSASDQEQVKTCMFNVTSIDACCPTFRSILGTSCPCYKFAEDLDNQVLITLQAYCDVDSPCRNLQVIKLSKEE
ncbi:uncharacterized protein LOC132069154 isoform X2 [Lycium ferocissimum]|uniref:uncharacterized protein LOC132069154 isoform X2 n=1 Tax=Lycium ferocissimum TaxID=112874 RepID=UPI0028166591|nr:uncharacterized protein LOC132069154 isoform X2 [Lycium ferocissimum]